MTFKKKKSACKKVCKTVGRRGGDFKQMDETQKREYFRIAMRRTRLLPESERVLPTTPPRSSSADATSSHHSVGRPPLGEKAMTPNSLRKRKRQSISDKRRKDMISKKRSAAAKKSWKKLKFYEEGEIASKTHEENDSTTDEENGVDIDVTEEDATGEINIDDEASRKMLWRLKCRLAAYLPAHVIDCFLIFKRIYGVVGDNEEFKQGLKKLEIPPGNLSKRQIKYRVKQIVPIFKKKTYQNKLLCYWLERLVAHPFGASVMTSIQIPTNLLPKALQVSVIKEVEIEKLLSRSIRSPDAYRTTGIQLILNVATTAKLSPENHGDVRYLSNAVSCTWKYAKKVLTAIKLGKVNDLFTYNTRCDAITKSDWPALLERFVLLPQNSRAVPGKETVSIRYGQRHEKFLLLKSKSEIIADFLKQNPDCQYRESILKREFPPLCSKAHFARPSRERMSHSCKRTSHSKRYKCNIKEVEMCHSASFMSTAGIKSTM